MWSFILFQPDIYIKVETNKKFTSHFENEFYLRFYYIRCQNMHLEIFHIK